MCEFAGSKSAKLVVQKIREISCPFLFSLLFVCLSCVSIPNKSSHYSSLVCCLLQYLEIGKKNLHSASISDPSAHNKQIYKDYKTVYQRVIRGAKKLYFTSKLRENARNPKKNMGVTFFNSVASALI